jgi:hypothetical protein
VCGVCVMGGVCGCDVKGRLREDGMRVVSVWCVCVCGVLREGTGEEVGRVATVNPKP